MVAEVEVPFAASMEKSVAVPVNVTPWEPPLASSVMATEAERLPLAVGLKFTPIVQFALTATRVPQVLVWEKSPLLAPKRRPRNYWFAKSRCCWRHRWRCLRC